MVTSYVSNVKNLRQADLFSPGIRIKETLGVVSLLLQTNSKITWLRLYKHFCWPQNLLISTFKALNHPEDQLLET